MAYSSSLGVDLPAPINDLLLRQGQPSPCRTSPNASCPRNYKRYWNINQFPIDYALPPGLRGRLTQGRLPLPWKPLVFGGRGSHPSFRYLYLHSLFQVLQKPSQVFLHRLLECSPTSHTECESIASVLCLAPLHCLRTDARPVSCYALF